MNKCEICQVDIGEHACSCTSTAQKLPEDGIFANQIKVGLESQINTLTPHEFKELVKVLPITEQLKLGEALLRVNCKKKKLLLHHILTQVSRKEADETIASFYNSIWQERLDPAFPLSVLERILRIGNLFLQKLIYKVIVRIMGKTEIQTIEDISKEFEPEDAKSWISVCSKSKLYFHHSSSTLHALVRRYEAAPKLMRFVVAFRQTVERNCDTPFELLYPDHLQALVRSMNQDVKTLPEESRNKVINDLLDAFVACRTSASCVLSHFPMWIGYAAFYAQEHGKTAILCVKLPDRLDAI